MASKRGRKDIFCFSQHENNNNNQDSNEDSEDRSAPVLPCFHEEVLDIVSELIMVASLPPNYEEIQEQQQYTSAGVNISLEETKYINASLSKVLGYARGSVPPPGTLVDIIMREGEYHGKILLENAKHEQIFFFVSGQIKHAKGLCFFKLTNTKDRSYILEQLYSKSEFMMTVIERGKEEEYEWRHLIPNTCFRKNNPIIKEFGAKEWYCLHERKKFYEAIDKSKATGTSIEVDNDNRSLNGFLLPPGVFLTYLYTDPNTNLDVVAVIIFDGEVLRAARERIAELKDFFENAPLMMGVIELRGESLVILYGNSATAEAYPNHSIGANNRSGNHHLVIDNIVDPKLIHQYRCLYKKSRESAEVVQAEIYDPDRNTHSHVTISTISYDRDSKISKHVYMVEDKTHQRLTELELERYKDSLEEKVQQRTLEVHEKELKFRTLVANAPNIILSVDRTGVIQFANRQFVESDSEMESESESEGHGGGSLLLGHRLDSLIVEGPELLVLLNQLFEDNNNLNNSSEIENKSDNRNKSGNGNGNSSNNNNNNNNNNNSNSSNSSSNNNNNNNNNGGKKVATATSFKHEVKLRDVDMWLTLSVGKMNENLAIVVATDITEIKQMSEELNLALTTKSRFLANMSHEIRTPLSGVIGMSRMLQETSLTMEQTECVTTIQHCGETLLSVINSILDYTKLEAAGTAGVAMTLEYSEISLQQCLEESLYTILPTAIQKKLDLILDIDQRVPDRILGDTIRLRQVMLNLLNNAVKFTDVGYILVALTAAPVEGSEDWKFNFSIHDTGCGVPPESQGKLFQMFSQVDVSSTRRYGGTGIGLALAKRFLEMMEGDITMQSSGVAGEGCTFSFSITATLVPYVSDSPTSVDLVNFLTTSITVIIVEPCQVASEVLKKRLNAKGLMSVETITQDPYNAFEEIQKRVLCANESHLFLIFCNIEALSPEKPYPLAGKTNVKTVFTGFLRPPTISSNEFLRKPIKESTLRACLKDFLSKHSFSPSPSSSASSSPAPSPLSSSQTISHTSILPSIPSLTVLPPLLTTTPPPPPSISRSISSLSPSPSSLSSSSTHKTSLSAQTTKLGRTSSKKPVVPAYPLSILVVEDNEINQKVVKRVITHLGYSSTMAMVNNGLEALEYIDSHPMPDTILMDIQMPVLDGLQTTRMIREKYPRSCVYIAATTANCFPEDRQNCMDVGMDDFLTKPLRIEQLQSVLHKSYILKTSQKPVP